MSAFDDHHSGAFFRSAEDPYEGKSFSEVLRAKREAMEQALKDQGGGANLGASAGGQPGHETLEERKQRLLAQRDALLKQRKAERNKELDAYKDSGA